MRLNLKFPHYCFLERHIGLPEHSKHNKDLEGLRKHHKTLQPKNILTEAPRPLGLYREREKIINGGDLRSGTGHIFNSAYLYT